MSHTSVQVPQPNDDRTHTVLGRTFSLFSLRHNVYTVPIDDLEEQRFEELHQIIRQLTRNEVVLTRFPPPGVDEPAVLDCGYGKGAWIDDLLAEYEDCLVTGVDLYLSEDDDDDDDDDEDSDGSAVQEFIKKRWNLNAPFRADRSSSRLKKEEFDLINSRFLADGISQSRWPTYIGELKKLLKLGGWLQMVELELMFQSENGRLTLDSSDLLYKWGQEYRDTMLRNHRDPRVGQKLGRMLRDEGFDEVSAPVPIRLEIGGWNPEASRSLGLDIRANLHKTLESVLLWPCAGHFQNQRPRMSVDEYRTMVRGAQRRIQDDSLRLYYNVYVARGRRPLTERRRP